MRHFLLAATACCVGLTGCSTTPSPVDIEGDDDRVTSPEVEVIFRIKDNQAQKDNREYAGISVGFSQGEGEFDQYINNGDYVSLDGTSIDGPATLNHQAHVDTIYARALIRSPISDSAEWYGAAGLGLLGMQLTSTNGAQQISTSDQQFTFTGLIGLAYRFTPTFGIEGSYGIYAQPFSFFSYSASLAETRFQLFLTPNDSVRLFAGYRNLGYELKDNSDSDIQFTLSGPTAGITLLF